MSSPFSAMKPRQLLKVLRRLGYVESARVARRGRVAPVARGAGKAPPAMGVPQVGAEHRAGCQGDTVNVVLSVADSMIAVEPCAQVTDDRVEMPDCAVEFDEETTLGELIQRSAAPRHMMV